MKYLLSVICLLLFVLGCKKENLSNAIIGTWELRKSIGWEISLQYQAGNGNLVVFDDKGLCTQKTVSADTAYSRSYLYKLIKAGDCNENLVLTSKEDGVESKEQVSISKDTLYLSTPTCYADGGTSVYVRVN